MHPRWRSTPLWWALLLSTACGKDETLAPKAPGHDASFSSGGRAGANGTATCRGCHADATGAALTITGPQTVSPGATNQYTATLTGGPAVVGGADVHVTGGTLASITGQGTKILNGDLVHSAPKSFSGGSVSWNFNWTAPATAGTVQMYGAGNSADGDGSDAGDAGDGAVTRSITVQAPAPTNQPPAANAGPDQTVNDADGNGAQTVALDGSGSTDDSGIASYAWTEGGQSLASGQKPSVSLAVGQHTITLTVTDNGSPALSATDVVVVTITPAVAVNQAPVANAGPDQAVTDADGNGAEQVTLDGSASTDDGSITSYAWSESGQPLATGAKPVVSLAVGQHTISLTVGDNGSPSLSATDAVVITVEAAPSPGQPPVAAAGGPYEAVTKQPVHFDGSGSSGTIVSYRWDFGDGRVGTGPTPKHGYACPGTFSVGLVVTDDQGTTATDVTQVVVTGRTRGASSLSGRSRERGSLELSAERGRCQSATSGR